MSSTDWKLIILFAMLELMLFAIGTALSNDSNRHEETLAAQQIVDIDQNKRIEALEKEVRLLKTDLYITQNGFEENKE